MNAPVRPSTAPTCKDCAAAGITTRRPAPHPGPRCTTHHRAARKAAKKRTAERRDANTYGLGPGDYDRILDHQGGRCAICQRATGATRRLAVDHDHATGAVRGLLCKTCNTVVLGRYDANALARAITYLAAPPAPRALGRTVTVPTHQKENR